MQAKLTPKMEATLLEFVADKHVADLGCGPAFPLARLMARTAEWVHAVDKEPMDRRFRLPKNVGYYQWRYHEFTLATPAVAVVSWPVNHPCPGLLEFVKQCEYVVYIGCNTGGTACGTPSLYEHLSTRCIIKEIRDRRNCLHYYGSVVYETPRLRNEEEVCGMLNGLHVFRPIEFGTLVATGPGMDAVDLGRAG